MLLFSGNDAQAFWLVLGFAGQGCFFLRFMIQWIVSEKNKESTIPVAFWYLSLVGAALVRNLVFLHRRPEA